MNRLAILCLAVWISACGGPSPPPPDMRADRPMRIVSLDYCADQYVLRFADREQVLAISPHAEDAYSYMRTEAEDLPRVEPLAENVLILQPDLIVRSYGGGPNAGVFFEQAGIPVLQVGWASAIDGEGPGTIPYVAQEMAEGLGHADRGEALVADYRARLADLEARASGQSALYMTPAGVTSGPGSLIHEMLLAAGLTNFQNEAGWRSLPLERLAYEQPDLVAAAFLETMSAPLDSWSPSKHPVAQAQLSGPDVVALSGAWTACGGWFLMDAIEALAEGAAS